MNNCSYKSYKTIISLTIFLIVVSVSHYQQVYASSHSTESSFGFNTYGIFTINKDGIELVELNDESAYGRSLSWGSNLDTIQLESNAGPDQNVGPESIVMLNGTGSIGDNPLTYVWTQKYGPTVTLDTKIPSNPTFNLPGNITTETTLTFELVVIDENGNKSKPSTTNIIVCSSALPCTDTDGDSLYDIWETNGIDVNNDGITDLVLHGANPDQKDIFVEADYMQTTVSDLPLWGSWNHKPSQNAINSIIYAFANGDVQNQVSHLKGINLQIDVNEAIQYYPTIVFGPAVTNADNDFWKIKNGIPNDGTKSGDCDGAFGNFMERNRPYPDCHWTLEAKQRVFHYVIFAHELDGSVYNAKGIAELGGNDIVIAENDWVDKSIDTTQKLGGYDRASSGNFMHELGHNLGLLHGGKDNINCKPNYFSVMNRLYNFPIYDPNAPLDYARGIAKENPNPPPSLDESNLSEINPIPYSQNRIVLYGDNNGDFIKKAGITNSDIDWNQNGKPKDTGVYSDVNNIIWQIDEAPNCDTSKVIQNFPRTGYVEMGEHGIQLLKAQNDWQNLEYNFRKLADYPNSNLDQ